MDLYSSIATLKLIKLERECWTRIGKKLLRLRSYALSQLQFSSLFHILGAIAFIRTLYKKQLKILVFIEYGAIQTIPYNHWKKCTVH